jgi:hypothetical protein
MNSHRPLCLPIFAMFSVMILLLSSCQPSIVVNSPQTTQPATQPSVTPVVVASQTPIETTPPSSGMTGDITLDYSAVAENMTIEIVPAVPASPDASWTDVAPEYRLLTLQGYPTTDNLHKPQIFVYPIDALSSSNETMAKVASDLQTVLQTHQIETTLPFLPLYNEVQAMNAQAQPLDFINGKGIRYLTQYNQGPVPINNSELFYTFQGLTNDGKYYVAAVLPVTNPGLQNGSEMSEEFTKSLSDNPGYYQEYLSSTVSTLNQQHATSFTPSLDNLDALIRSLTVPAVTAIIPTQPTNSGASDEVTLDYSALAQDVTIETIPAVPFDPYLFWTAIGPEYRLLTLEGYPIANNEIKPQIFIYPVSDMALYNEDMSKIASNLQSLLQTHQTSDGLPFLPLINALQAMNAQVQYLDFASGTGVRYLTQYNQGPVPINNAELIYTFQGLSSDGKSYIAAVLPITHPELQAGPEFSDEYSQALTDNPGYYMNYITNTVDLLNQSPVSGFSPSLDELDALVRSITLPPNVEATTTPEVFNPAPIEAVLTDKTRDDLASRLGMERSSISVVDIGQQTWPDSCLGLAPTGTLECTKSDVAGYRVLLNAAGHTHEYRATMDGSLLSYSGPVTVAGPEACKLNGTSMIYSPEDGYCFSYPVRFHRTDERGPIAIYGPASGPGPEPLYAAVTLEISSLPEGQTLDDVANNFIAQLGDVPTPQTRLTQMIDGETALMLEVVPGMLGSRDLFVIHEGKLFHFTFWPAPSVATETEADVKDLYRTVTQSFHFQS